MATLDAYLKGVAAAVSLTFALAVWWGGRERRETRLLALFLALIGANQAFETLRALDPGGAAGWLRAATVAAALDPLALVAYARGRLGERFVPRRLVLAAGAASVALALAAPWVVPREQRVPASHAVETALVAYTAAAYSLVLVAYARALRDDAARPAEAPLYVGVSLVAMPLWSRAAGDVVALASTWPRLAPLAPAKVLVGLAVA
ncbi:MAG TPA: hypothetical protein VNX21_04210, partial [Candidatus Thermoplasmatota archaeon]|nr:hypothetical protein [Candidatus Thermoplasmatota archaeon]